MKKTAKQRPVATFTRSDDFARWHDENGDDYSETEIDGNLVGILWDEGKIVGLWYNEAGFGTISTDFATLFPDAATDDVCYSEKDKNYPY